MAIAEPLEPVDPGRSDEPMQTSAAPARRSSFYMAMRVLPPAQRDAMYEIYSFCRAVDDIADDPGCHATRLAELNMWRARIDALYPGSAPSVLETALPTRVALESTNGVATGAMHGTAPLVSPTVSAGLAAAVKQFDLIKADFLAVIDGMQMDLDADIQAPDFATLDLYCDRVASAVGRLSTQVFGLSREHGVKLAYSLGRALQFTNILRDLDEDADINRLYLCHESLEKAGITARTPAAVLAAPGLAAACDWLAKAALDHYAAADALMRDAPRKLVRAPRLMSVVYRDILEKTIARGWEAPRTRVRVPRAKLVWLLLRHGLV